ncbi:SIR2 family protein [Candidatus Methylospira mobilis]|uniref:SIR2 family protein n=1 Tax=Candidatus Methylospira mobilis TaxID=1808979 RepID=UPI0028E42502|nr:SIR2 family protein [Candidatus Methylospira mobilis]WNV04032.1 SIR2 family protein [Candidatus Methylospira mobilis]
MKTQFHCPYRQSTLLQQALAPDKMRIAFFLGAGCPYSIQIPDGTETKPLIPDIRGLTELVSSKMSAAAQHKMNYATLLKRFDDGALTKPTIEDILSHIRALQEVVRNGEIDGLNKTTLAALDAEICSITTDVVGVALPESNTPYHQLATWIGGIQRTHPIEVFTPNYDLLVEQALESHKVPYFDGFVGSKQAFFDLTSMENELLPPRWGRLWKIHGSVNWWRTPNDEVVRREGHAVGDRQMIYPSHLKYDQSRRMPYLAMLDRLRAFLARGQAVLVTCGYSFADVHLNEVIFQGLRSNPTAICFGLLFGSRSGYADTTAKARTIPNLSLLAADGAVLGTSERDWRRDEQTEHALHGISITKEEASDTTTKSCKFLLGDFNYFGNFLAQQLSWSDGERVSTDAS